MSKELLSLLCVNTLKEKELYDIFRKAASFGEIEALVSGRFTAADIACAHEQLKTMSRLGHNVMTILDDTYPAPLRQIPYAPPVIFSSGSYDAADLNAIAFVGARNASDKGRLIVDKFIGEMAGLPITIVSGMAVGIDTYAHCAALANGLRTIAVLGSGLDFVYPAQNKPLFRRIAERGVIFSEHPPGTRPLPYHFPKRNRIISGLSKAVVIVEAGIKSGSLITARYAAEHNRELFAVPRTPVDRNSDGVNSLIKSGAKISTSGADIVADLFPGLAVEKPFVLPKLTREEETILKEISEDPVNIDTLCFTLDIGPATLANFLLHLELKGLIAELPGRFYVRR